MLNDRYEHRSRSKGSLKVHLIFVTRFRRSILIGKRSEDCKMILTEITKRYGWSIIQMETDSDHVHMLLQHPPTVSVSEIAQRLKRESTYCMRLLHSKYLKQHYWQQNTLWSKGYFFCSIGEVSSATIMRYIENQG